MSLLPYAIFSLFHALTFLRSNALPHFFPPSPPAAAGEPAQQHPLLKRIQVWIKSKPLHIHHKALESLTIFRIKANYDTAMTIVAYTELAILARVVLGALFRMNSLLTPILFAHFVRTRYFQSTFTRKAVGRVGFYVDGYVGRQGTPPVVKSVWAQVKVLLSRWAGGVLVPNQNQAPTPNRPARG